VAFSFFREHARDQSKPLSGRSGVNRGTWLPRYLIHSVGYRVYSVRTTFCSDSGKGISLPESSEAVRQSGNTLLKRPEEFQSKEPHLADRVLAEYSGGDGRGLAGDDSGRGGGRSGDGEMDDLVGAEHVGSGHTGTRGSDVEGLCKLDEFGPGSVSSAQEDGHL
jgi:hypothetical protein